MPTGCACHYHLALESQVPSEPVADFISLFRNGVVTQPVTPASSSQYTDPVKTLNKLVTKATKVLPAICPENQVSKSSRT